MDQNKSEPPSINNVSEEQKRQKLNEDQILGSNKSNKHSSIDKSFSVCETPLEEKYSILSTMSKSLLVIII